MACRCCPGGIGRSTRVPRYPSDMSDAEWQVIEPGAARSGLEGPQGGRPAERCRRDYVDAIRYLVKEGIQWRAMPADLPHWRTVYDVADGWHKSGATGKMHVELRRQCRIAAGRTPEPTAAIIDSQSVKAADEVSRASRVTTRARRSRAASGTCRRYLGLLLVVVVTQPTCRTATGQALFLTAPCLPSVTLAGPTAATPASWSAGPGPSSSPG